jgi:methanogenic corrinoid protein MtbC1
VTVTTELDRERERLWSAVSGGDEFSAAATVLAAVDAGLDPESALLDIVAPVQARVGAEWATNSISVAQEHTATAINDRVIAALAHHPAARREPHLGRVAVACVDGEWHALPARLLSEVLRLRGWQVDFLGAQVPTPHLVAHLHQRGPDALALSSSIPTRLPTAHATITACQATGMPVIAGGAAFGFDGRYARLLGADAWAPDARTAAELLLGGLASPSATPAHSAVDDLPHLVDQEYTLVSRTAAQLVRTTLGEVPEVAGYTARQRQHAAEDVARTVDFLATALYVDDDTLFTEHMRWHAEILTARAIPTAVLRTALGALRAQLTDFPRAARMLAASIRCLQEETT